MKRTRFILRRMRCDLHHVRRHFERRDRGIALDTLTRLHVYTLLRLQAKTYGVV
jgi:hypothetical protein